MSAWGSTLAASGAQAAKVLVVLSDENHLDLKDGKVLSTGFYLNELMQPVKLLLDAGHKVTFATPQGRAPTVDASSVTPAYFGNDAAQLTLHKDLLSKPLRSYLRDVQDNAMIVSDHVSAFDERLSSLLDASVAKVSMQQNSDMRTISAVVGMAAAPTMIAGIYGMNFAYMPELAWRWGYPAILILMATVMGVMYWWFRKNHWL